MKIETRYAPEDKVWVIDSNQVVELTVRSVHFTAGASAGTLNEVTTYEFKERGIARYEKDIYHTKEELLQAL